MKNLLINSQKLTHLVTKQSVAKKLTKLTLTSALLSVMALSSGCSLFSVYKIDIPQGTPITQKQAKRVQVGMSQAQVLYLLGNPAFKDTIEANRWDYIYDYEAGTVGKREHKPNVHNAQQHLVVYFANGKVSRIQGLKSLPVK